MLRFSLEGFLVALRMNIVAFIFVQFTVDTAADMG